MRKFEKILVFILAFVMLTGCSRTGSNKKSGGSGDKKISKMIFPYIIDFGEGSDDKGDKEENTEPPENYAERIDIASKDDIDKALEYDSIQYLKIDGANIEDFSFLHNIKIEMLQVIRNKYPLDMECINSDAIEQLYLHSTPIKNQSCASDFKKLENFTMLSDKNNTEITSLDFLKDCKKLSEIHVANYAIENLNFAKKLKKLDKLTITNSAIESLDGIENCSGLTYLSVTRAKISDISSLRKLDDLQNLDLSDNRITDVGSIQFKDLTSLNLSDNFIKDVTALSKNRNLSFIVLSKNYISEFPSELLKDDTHLDLSYNNIRTLTDKDKSALKNNVSGVNLFDNLLDSSTLKEVSNYDCVFFNVGETPLSADEAIKYNDKIKEILAGMGDDDDENIMRVSKYVMDNGKMDHTYVDTYKDCAYGALFTKAVCTGFTELTNTLCRHLDIEVKTYHGDIADPDDGVRHVWSVCNGYHVDALQGMVHKNWHGYSDLVLLSDRQLEQYGHILDALNIPKITKEKSAAEMDAIYERLDRE